MNITIVAGLISAIITTIKTVEARSIEAKAKGEETFTGDFKLQLALGILEDVYNLTAPKIPFNQIKDTVTTTINTLVAVYNALGLFKKA